MTIKRFSIKEPDIFFLDGGAGGDTLLCLHGKWGRGETFYPFFERYADRYRVVAPDQRGHGLSGKPVARYGGEEFAEDMHALIERLGCGPVIAVGHSLGGRNAAYLAALYPEDVKALAILDSKATGKDRPADILPENVEPMDRLTKDWPTPYPTYADAVKDLKGHFPLESNLRYFLQSLAETPEGYDFVFSRYSMAAIDVYYRDWHHILTRINCPTLLVRAKESWHLTGREAMRMKSLIKDCRYAEVAGSDHMVYADNPAEFFPVLDAFLKTL